MQEYLTRKIDLNAMRDFRISDWQPSGFRGSNWERALDFAWGSLLTSVVTLPSGLLIAPVSALDTREYPLLRQPRRGKDGGVLRIPKWKSMKSLPKGQVDNFQGVRNPRTSKVGDKIRASGLDESLQFALVLAGTLSLVARRPEEQKDIDRKMEAADYFAKKGLVIPDFGKVWLDGYDTYKEGILSDSANLRHYYQETTPELNLASMWLDIQQDIHMNTTRYKAMVLGSALHLVSSFNSDEPSFEMLIPENFEPLPVAA